MFTFDRNDGNIRRTRRSLTDERVMGKKVARDRRRCVCIKGVFRGNVSVEGYSRQLSAVSQPTTSLGAP